MTPLRGWHYWAKPRPMRSSPIHCTQCGRLVWDHAPTWRRILRRVLHPGH